MEGPQVIPDDAARAPMRAIPHWIDKGRWMTDNPREYFAFARHLTEQNVYYERTGKRKPMHSADKTEVAT
jgi:hypothetical protein